jgi:hypothetical protein
MSYIFDVGDDTVWSPALRVGEAYVGFAHQLGALLDTETGLHQVAEDMVEIDVGSFERFARALLDSYVRSSHPIYRELSRGPLLVSLALLGRAGRVIEPMTQEERDLNRQAMEHAERMPS